MLCSTRRSLQRTSTKSRRYPANRRPGRCVECGTLMPTGQGCVDVLMQGRSVVYC